MYLIEFIYIAAALIALSAGVPQLRQLLVSKASDEFSLSTWFIWLSTQCVTLAYVTTIGNTIMMVVNIAWVLFYAAMVGLILYFRRTQVSTIPVVIDDEPA